MIAHRRFWSGALGALLLAMAPFGRSVADTRGPGADVQEARALAAAIDRRLAEKWAEANVQPGPRADDAEFLRRVSLDIAGKIATAAETRDFLDDPSPEKRARLVETLLQSSAYVNHFTDIWRNLLLPEADAGGQVQFLAPDFENWLRQQLTTNAGYDKIARELISLSLNGTNNSRGVNPFDRTSNRVTPVAYYFAKEAKPENLAAGTARTFLGIRIECAQCHDHPFARWTREQFWGYAAFFGGIQKQGEADQFGPIREIADRRELAIPGTEKVVQASFLDGEEPQWRFRVGSRVTLADWMTAPENPYFARAGVNRIWAQLFGIGLVDPVDDLNDANPPSHPELLDELAKQFAKHKYDLKFLIRALTMSEAYQLTSDATGATQVDPRLFARMAVKGLTGEQLFESIVQATGRTPEIADRFRGGGQFRNEFLQKFPRREEKPTETQSSILQALAMMNGRLIAESTSLAQGATLGAVAEAPFLDTAGKIETLYLATLNRRPRPDELARMVEYVDRKERKPSPSSLIERLKSVVVSRVQRQNSPSPATAKNEALADVFWVLMNSAEFLLNH